MAGFSVEGGAADPRTVPNTLGSERYSSRSERWDGRETAPQQGGPRHNRSGRPPHNRVLHGHERRASPPANGEWASPPAANGERLWMGRLATTVVLVGLYGL